MITTNDVLARLRNGESMDTIGQSIADVLNAAQDAYIAEQELAKEAQAKEELAQSKRNLALAMIDVIQQYGELVAPEAADVLDDVSDDDIEAMITAMDEMFKMMTALAQLKETLNQPAIKVTPRRSNPVRVASKSDDEVLANFIKSLV